MQGITEKTILDSKPLDVIYVNKESETEIANYIGTHCTTEETERLKNVGNLMSGYESPFGLELLATVDWIKHKDRPAEVTPEYLKEKIAQWSDRKNEMFTLDHLEAAARRLSEYSAEFALLN